MEMQFFLHNTVATCINNNSSAADEQIHFGRVRDSTTIYKYLMYDMTCVSLRMYFYLPSLRHLSFQSFLRIGSR